MRWRGKDEGTRMTRIWRISADFFGYDVVEKERGFNGLNGWWTDFFDGMLGREIQGNADDADSAD